MDPNMINEFELLGHNAWVAEERLRLGGWILRADHGVTRRANSVLPVAPQNIPLDFAIDSVIDFYRSRDLTPRFQMTEASHPHNLDVELEHRDFVLGLQVEIWTAPIISFLISDTKFSVETSDIISKEWIDTYNSGSNHDSSTIPIRKSIMERTLQPKTFAFAMIDEEIAAVGYGVVEGEWLGVFNIATRPDRRHLGAATAVNKQLGIWAQTFGAKNAYLQVEMNNYAAKELYKKLGFSCAYNYWYRDLDVKEDNTAGC
ncbi:GNAT family N-acetyltransferase [Candidatus Thorarchaeota archaeon]|nr:MAG: GNAT family N-acetyltransferase [Candidatus Thorarchaeota archaeon]